MGRFVYIARRLMLSALVLLGMTLVVFVLTRIVPSDPAALYLGPRARPAELERVARELGFDRPLPQQYLIYLGDLLRGDLGDSIATKRPVAREIGDRAAATLELLLVAMALAVAIGIPLGVLSTRLRGRALDLWVRVVSVVGVSMPAFWLGLLLQVLFAHVLGLLPVAGRVDTALRFISPIRDLTGFWLLDTAVTGNWVALWDVFRHLLLPALTLAAYPAGLVARMTRGTMLEVLEQDYIRTARAYGVAPNRLYFRHALRNAVGPTLTVIGLTLAYALTGAFYVEVIFNWPGLGLFTVRSFLNLDYPAIMGVTLLAAGAYVLVNLAVDVLQAWVEIGRAHV